MGTMSRGLLLELADMVMREAQSIDDMYAWPPRTPDEDVMRERDRLLVVARRIAYRARSL